MASIIKLKRSGTTGVVPSGGALLAGELAINLADKKLFSSTNGTDIITIGGDVAERLTNARTIALSGDVTGSVTFDGSADVTISATIASNSVALGTDTTGDYVDSLIAGTNVTISGGTGEGSTPTISVTSLTGDVTGDVTGNVTGDLTGDVYASDGTTKVLENGNGADAGATFTGDVTGNVSGNAGTVTNGVYTTDTGTVTNAMLAGAITNAKLVNSSVTVGSTAVALGGSATTLDGLTSVTSSAFVGPLTGNVTGNVTGNLTGTADTASALATSRSITLGGDVTGTASFDGSADVTITATIAADSVALGTDTTGNYVSDVSGTANEIVVTGTAGEDASFQIGLPDDVTIANDLTVTNDLVVSGNLTVAGTTTEISSSTVTVEDSMLKLADGNVGDAIDTGVYGKYVESATNKYSGYFRDASDSGIIKFFDGIEAEPGTTVDTTDASYALAKVQADFIIDGGSF